MLHIIYFDTGYALPQNTMARIRTVRVRTDSRFLPIRIVIICTLEFLYNKRWTKDEISRYVPVVWNTILFGIPLMELWKGFAAVNMIVVFDQIQDFWKFTMGIAIVSGGFSTSGFKEILKSPLLWAIISGCIVSCLGIRLPAPIEETVRFGGSGASVPATFLLGYSVAERCIKVDRHIIAGTLIKYIGGFLSGLAACRIFGITGITRQVVIVASSLPSAVFTFVLPLRYGLVSNLPGSLVIFTTVLGIVAIPALLYLAGVV